MKSARFAISRSATLKASLTAAAVLSLVSACSKVSEAKAGGEPTLAAALQGENVPATASSPENANYKVSIKPAPACRRGETCTVEVALEAKGDYHVNDKYPYKFKTDEPAQGVKYPKPVVGKEDAQIEEKKVLIKVPFVSDGAGDKRVSGVFWLSVCSSANCLMDKQPLEVIVKVD
jgi:hypothetical protein